MPEYGDPDGDVDLPYDEMDDEELAEVVYDTENMMHFYQHEAADGRIEDDELVDETLDRLAAMRDGAVETLRERNDLPSDEDVREYLQEFDL